MHPDLFPYQREGAPFLAARKHALLADEMGLGKTAQCVTACDILNAQRVLVVCPAIARVNWIREFEQWSIFDRPASAVLKGDDPIEPDGVTTISFDLMAKPEIRLVLESVEWDVLIVDEAHFLKTPSANRTKAITGGKRKIKDGLGFKFEKIDGLASKAKHIWMVSGTPAPNNPSELYTIVKLFGKWEKGAWEFTRAFCKGYDDGFGNYKITGAKNVPRLRSILSEFMIRRKKVDVLKQLPPITFKHSAVEMEQPDLMTYFPQYARFPHNLKYVEKMNEAVIKAFRTASGEDKLKVLQGLAKNTSEWRRYVGLAKAPGAARMISHWLDHGMDKIVVFAWHRDVMMLLRDNLLKYKPVLVFGGTPAEKRQKKIDRFNKGDKTRVFIGQILAAGTNITLTSAHNIAIVEASWVPGENAQAIMRVHRIGQTQPVSVHFINLYKSIDNDIQRVIKLKTQMLTQVFD